MNVDGIPYGRRIREVAMRDPDAIALTFAAADGSLTELAWRTVDERSTQVARTLADEGLGEGDLLAIRLRNSPEFIYSAFAAWKLGAVPIPMRWDLPNWELERVHAVVNAKVVLSESSAELFERSLSESTEPLGDVVSPHHSGICSSGSTGTPKVIVRQAPAVYTPASASSLVVIEEWGELPRPQLVLTPGPMYHNNGFHITSDLLAGLNVVLMEKFDAALLVDLVEQLGVTGMTGATPMYQRVAQLPGVRSRDFSSMQWVMQGASPLPAWVARVWFDLIGPERFFMAYAASEGVGTIACRGDEWLAHPGTLGRGWRGVEVRILNGEKQPLPSGEVGDIYLRPPNGIRYVYLGAERTADVTPDGFTTVGDMGWMDEDGFVFLADRRVDMIVTGGSNVYPAEVEVALSEHPAIADIVVVGLPDETWGKRVHAIVQRAETAPALSEADVMAFGRDRLASYKLPKSIEFVDAIPRAASMKVSRSALVAERSGEQVANV
jgi:bile acid-coenzyme A ligase